jgi:hypothetical protein
MQCRHLDGIPDNNHLSNLAWGTPAENYNDRRHHGTASEGERHGSAVLNAEKVLAIYNATERVSEIAAQFDVTPTAVSKIKNGKSWSSVTGAVEADVGHAGERNGRAKLTAEQVLVIRASTESQRALAAKFEVSHNLISAIKCRTVWRHLDA